MLLTITACGGDEDTDNVIKQAQLEKTGVNTLIQSSTDQNTIYQVSVLNPSREATKVQLSVYTQEELNNYNQQNKTNYQLLPEDAYSLPETTVSFTNGEEKKTVRFTLNTDILVSHIKEQGKDPQYCLPIKLNVQNQYVIYVIKLSDIDDILKPEEQIITFNIVNSEGELITDETEFIISQIRTDFNAYVPKTEQTLTGGIYTMPAATQETALAITVVTKNYNPKKIELNLPQTTETIKIELEPRSGTRIMSYNILDGWRHNQDNIDAFTEWVQRFDPDIIMFCELNNNQAGIKYDEDLLALSQKWGHNYAVVLKDWGYPTGISSRYEITDIEKIQIEGMDGYRVHGFIEAQCNNLMLYACHLSSQWGPLREKEAAYIADRAKLHSYAFVAGDMNTDSPFDRDILTPNTWPSKTGRSDNSIEYTVVPKFTDAGLKDVFIESTKAFKASFSFGKDLANSNITGLRLDQAYATPALSELCDFADILNTKYTRGASDHFPGLYHIQEFK